MSTLRICAVRHNRTGMRRWWGVLFSALRPRRTIEEVGVVVGGQAIQVKDVAQVIELPVRVPAHRHVLIIWDADIH